MNRRQFASSLFGVGAGAVATTNDAAAETALIFQHPQCPKCLMMFGLQASKDGKLEVLPNYTFAPKEDFRKKLPAHCECGWRGLAEFCK